MKQKCVFVRKGWREKGYTTISIRTTICTTNCTTVLHCTTCLDSLNPLQLWLTVPAPPAVFLAAALQPVFT